MTMDIITLALLFAPLLLLLGLGFVAAIDPYIRREQRHVVLVIVALSLTLITQNLLENSFFVNRSNLALKNLLSAYGYSVRPVILILFLCIVQPDGKRRLHWATAGINAALYFTSPFTGLCFEIRESDYAFLRGPLWLFCFVFSAILLIELLTRTILFYRGTGKRERLIPVSVVLMIIVSVALDVNVGMESQPISFLTIAIVVGCVFYYIWLHMQFVREHEATMLLGQRVQLSLSQIKPHFLYNSLNVIEDLCDEDPRLAKEAINMFSLYLRGNMASIDIRGPIPFRQELEHTKTYIGIEKLRFEDTLEVCYDIACTDFHIPALTVEPLVENAVKHGVRANKDGRGTVIVATRELPDRFEVVITDDGPGFDPSRLPGDGETHVGIANVRQRLAQVCGGSLEIRSVPGRGTTATIILPKGKQEARTC